jgi:formyl-CoA transferase
MAADPHYQARGMHVEWRDEQLGRNVTGIGIVPKFSRTPGKIWRGSVKVGHDNDLVYGKVLGLSNAEIEELRRANVI